MEKSFLTGMSLEWDLALKFLIGALKEGFRLSRPLRAGIGARMGSMIANVKFKRCP